MRTVGFTAADIAAKEGKTEPAVKIGKAAIDDINRAPEGGGENDAPPEKPKGGRPRKAKEKSEATPPDEADGGADEEPVTDENGEADEADSDS